MKVHPAAELFPMMDDEQFATLRADVKANGLLNPLAVLADGSLIDGRNRLRACEELGIKPKTVTVTCADPVAYVLSANLARRHLSASQRAAVGAKAMPLLQQQARERMVEGGKVGAIMTNSRGVQKVAPPAARPAQERIKARDAAAKLTGANHQYIDRANRLMKNHPDLFGKVESGRMTINEAHRTQVEREGTAIARPKKPSEGAGEKEKPLAGRALMVRKAFERKVAEIVGVVVRATSSLDFLIDRFDDIRSSEDLHRMWKERCRDAFNKFRQAMNQFKE